MIFSQLDVHIFFPFLSNIIIIPDLLGLIVILFVSVQFFIISMSVLVCVSGSHTHAMSSAYPLTIIPLISNAVGRSLMNRLNSKGEIQILELVLYLFKLSLRSSLD